VAEGGDNICQVIFVAQLEEVFLRETGSLSLRMKWGIYTPSRNEAVGDIWGRIIRPKLGQIIRPAQIFDLLKMSSQKSGGMSKFLKFLADFLGLDISK
jgi:hypothetical protein